MYRYEYNSENTVSVSQLVHLSALQIFFSSPSPKYLYPLHFIPLLCVFVCSMGDMEHPAELVGIRNALLRDGGSAVLNYSTRKKNFTMCPQRLVLIRLTLTRNTKKGGGGEVMIREV